MFVAVGIVFHLALTTSLANGEKRFTFVNMTDAELYDSIPCPDACGDGMAVGLQIVSQLLKSINDVRFPVDFCQECVAQNLSNFTVEHNCFMNPQKDIFDHHLVLKFPKLVIGCKCNLTSSASATAKKINKGKISEGSCGRDNYKNNQGCKPVTCDGKQGGDGQSHVRLAVDLTDSKMSAVIRVDTRENPVTHLTDAFALQLSVTPSTDSPISYEGPPEFAEAGKCLAENTDGLICRMLANLPTPFLDCMDPTSLYKFVGGIVYLAAKY